MSMNTKSNQTLNPSSPTGQTAASCPRGRWLQPGLMLLTIAVAALLAGCQQTKPEWVGDTTPSPTPTPAGSILAATNFSSPSTVLREGDVIQLAFEAETNLNTVAKIQLDGRIVLPMVGEVKAVGKTLAELEADLQKSYEKFIKTTDLTLTLTSTSASIYVSGAVLHPGRIPLDRPLTAMEAVMEAGGFDLTRAKTSDVSVLRIVNGQQMRFRLNLKAALRDGDLQPFQLQPFDILHVPEKTFNL